MSMTQPLESICDRRELRARPCERRATRGLSAFCRQTPAIPRQIGVGLGAIDYPEPNLGSRRVSWGVGSRGCEVAWMKQTKLDRDQ